MREIVLKDESYAVMGACFEVYKEIGPGFLEAVYQECLSLELAFRRIPFVSQVELPLSYKGTPLEKTYRADFLAYGEIILEIKAVSDLANEHRAQVHNYLKATGYRLGILLNFGHAPKLQYERIVHGPLQT